MEKYLSLEGKIALVTGASRGIGRAIAEMYLDAGAVVIGIARSSSAKEIFEEWKDKYKDKEEKFSYYLADISHLEDIEEVFADVKNKFGRLDILVNNAGITRDQLLLRMKKEEWDEVISVNLGGIFNVTKTFLRLLLKSKGSIINITSVIGLMGNVGQANYAASKAGVIGFTKSLAKEVARKGLRVNAIAPGYIQTDMTEAISEDAKKSLQQLIPMGRLGEVKDVAAVALFLASPLASYITGQVLVVDGGMVM